MAAISPPLPSTPVSPFAQRSCAARRASSGSLGVSAAKELYLISAPIRIAAITLVEETAGFQARGQRAPCRRRTSTSLAERQREDQQWNSSMSPCSSSVWIRFGLPRTRSSGPSCCS